MLHIENEKDVKILVRLVYADAFSSLIGFFNNTVSIQGESMVEITIRSLTGRSIPVEIDLQQRVSDLKEVVEVKEGIPPAQQRFLFPGRQLDDDKPLAECGVANGSDLHLVLSLRGGML